MKEISLYILDIAQNAVRAGAKNIGIYIEEEGSTLSFTAIDDGCGMKKEQLKRVSDPFFTTRTTRKVGLGIPFLRQAAEQTGGEIEVQSRSREEFPHDHGTRLRAVFLQDSPDALPMGDIVSTVVTLIQGADGMDYDFAWRSERGEASLSTKAMRGMLGSEVPLSSPEVLAWASRYLNETLKEIFINL